MMLSANKVLGLAPGSKPVTRSGLSLFAVFDPLRLHHAISPRKLKTDTERAANSVIAQNFAAKPLFYAAAANAAGLWLASNVPPRFNRAQMILAFLLASATATFL